MVQLTSSFCVGFVFPIPTFPFDKTVIALIGSVLYGVVAGAFIPKYQSDQLAHAYHTSIVHRFWYNQFISFDAPKLVFEISVFCEKVFTPVIVSLPAI